MKLRRINTKLTNWKLFFVVAFIVTLIAFAKMGDIKNSFLKYSDMNAYHPKNDALNAKGLVGKINAYLQVALDSVNGNASDVFERYPRLSLTYPLDTTDFSTFSEVRLTGYVPVTKLEKEFYHNSQFKKLILQQSKDLSEEFFKIHFSNDHSRIDSIVVDEVKLLTILSNESWKGTIRFKDPTFDWDSKRKFIVCEGEIIPLFTTNNRQQLKHVVIPGEENNLTPNEIINAYWNDHHGLSITIHDKLNFSVVQTDEIVEVSTADTTFKIDFEGKLYTSVKRFSSTDSSTKNIFFKFKKGNIVIPVTITKRSPYEMGSQVANGAYAGNTIDMDTSYSDLYSRQIIRSIHACMSNPE